MANDTSRFELGTAKVVDSKPLQTSDSKWIGLKNIEWIDETGKERLWEWRVFYFDCIFSYRKRSGVESENIPDAVAVFSVLSRPSLPDATVLVLQYRPPVGKIVVELPAGLVDSNETSEQTALRELYEETGYGKGPDGGKAVVEKVTRILANDPGMSSANMSLVKIKITLDSDKAPEPQPEREHILVQVVPLVDLHETLLEYSEKDGYMVDARLMHLSIGISG
ncbi:NUDIX hydrolase domain-like protein [Phakopsora pachyrhizi]|uniref:NUDIX hydrolase domain-like protein n=1 Tax=Phakopsora pachyrhizi TaxID=170000 RepID=A0AAV0AF38_PHAPC|nr:NUDIX hydrolase domain-like protein [Phakopsora pachyrhizi]